MTSQRHDIEPPEYGDDDPDRPDLTNLYDLLKEFAPTQDDLELIDEVAQRYLPNIHARRFGAALDVEHLYGRSLESIRNHLKKAEALLADIPHPEIGESALIEALRGLPPEWATSPGAKSNTGRQYIGYLRRELGVAAHALGVVKSVMSRRGRPSTRDEDLFIFGLMKAVRRIRSIPGKKEAYRITVERLIRHYVRWEEPIRPLLDFDDQALRAERRVAEELKWIASRRSNKAL